MSDDEYPLGEWVYPTPEELAAAREAYHKRQAVALPKLEE
tara:strand:+ start:1033 stop:1152 length:120 start_codon:yes stop_codon:yes gene_type:complete